MKNSLALLAFTVALFAGGAAVAQDRDEIHNLFSVTAEEQMKTWAPDAVLTAFVPGLTESQKMAALARHGLTPDPNSPNRFFVRALISPFDLARGMTVPAKVEAMSRDRAFRYAEPDFALFPDQLATDPNFGTQWGLHNTGQSSGVADADIDAPEGWQLVNLSAPPVVIAVLDNGTDVNHPDLAANVWTNAGEIAADGIDNDGNGFIDDTRGWDFSNNDNNPLPTGSNTHGTHCHGIIGMVRDNGIGGAGAAINTRVMALQIAGGPTSFYSALANAIDYASLNGAKVISVSYSIDGFSNTLSDAVGRAASRDVVYMNSAGNNAQNIDDLRGRLRTSWSNVAFVASTDRNDALSGFSNFGFKSDLAAPGSSIYSTYPNNTYASISGTSMATPMAAAVVGQIRQAFPTLTAEQALRRARLSSDRLPSLNWRINGGRVNLARALEADNVAPSSPTGLTVVRRSSSAIAFRFNAAGDDGPVGAAAGYEIRASLAPITEANFNNAVNIPNAFGGQAQGVILNHQATGLSAGAEWYLAVRALDNAGNASPITTTGPIRLADAFWMDSAETATLWTPSGTWATTTAQRFRGARSWTDSPAGNYGNSANSSLTMANPITLPAEPILRFQAFMDLEWSFDFLTVELSADNGATWIRVGNFSGGDRTWRPLACSLSPWAGQSVRLRFRLTSDTTNTRDGVYLDDIAIVSGSRVWFDNVEGADQFARSPSTSTWAKSTTNPFSGSNSWTDSPSGNTPSSVDWSLRTTTNRDITNVGSPEFFFAMRNAVRRTDVFASTFSHDNGVTWVENRQWTSPSATWSLYSAPVPPTSSTRFGFRLYTFSGTTQDGVFLDDIGVVGDRFLSGLSGAVTREQHLGASGSRPVTLEIRQPGTDALIEVVNLSLSANSAAPFAFDTTASGTANLVFRAPGFLSRRLNGVTLGWNTVLSPISLPNGDVDGSGEVDLTDLDQVIARYLTNVGDPGYSLLHDVNGDGATDLTDLDIVIGSYGLSGE